jgi:hypothetical protein
LSLAFLFFFGKNLKNTYPTVLHLGLAFWACFYLLGQTVHICKPAEHMADAIAANPALLLHTKISRQVKLGPQFGKCQVNFAKLLEMVCFSLFHFVLGVSKLQQMAKKNKCQTVGIDG